MGLLKDASESEWLCVPFVFFDLGSSVRSDRRFIHPLIHKVLSWIPFPVGMTLIVVLGIVMFADLYVTASTILKMNKHLEKMKEIATDLHRISDELGENIYQEVVEVLERRDEWKLKVQEASDGVKGKIQDVSDEAMEKLRI